MDTASIYALTYSLLVIAVVGGLLFMTRPPSTGPSTPWVDPNTLSSAGEGAKKYGGLLAVGVPYALLGFGPLVDLYYREFKYSILTVIGAASVVIGYAYQYILRGSSSFLPSLTIATSAVVSYIVYDFWAQGTSRLYTTLATFAGAAVIWSQASTNEATTIFASKGTNDAVSVFLGLALGALSWMIVWNTDKKYLFQSQLPKSESSK